MRCKLCLVSRSSGTLDSSIPAACVQYLDYRIVAGLVDTFIHAQKPVQFSDRHCLQFPIIDAEVECAVFFRDKQNRWAHFVWASSITTMESIWKNHLWKSFAFGTAWYGTERMDQLSVLSSLIPCCAGWSCTVAHLPYAQNLWACEYACSYMWNTPLISSVPLFNRYLNSRLSSSLRYIRTFVHNDITMGYNKPR